MIVEITSTEIDTHSGVSQKSGKPYTIHKQSGYFFKEGEKYPAPFQIRLQTNDQGIPVPYNPGRYRLAPSSFYVDRYQSLSVNPTLVAITETARKAS